MSNKLQSASLVKEVSGGEACVYRLKAEDLHNNYYIVSSPGTRRLMAFPEVVGYASYQAMVPPTVAALNFLKDNGLGGDFSIITILRGGLNYPLEEAAHECGLQVSNMNFLSCERIIENKVITGLDIKYEKLHIQENAQFLIGDIIASGDTLKLCLNHVLDRFKRKEGSIKRIVFFTIGGTKAIDLLESRFEKIRSIWPEFEGFDCFFYEGIFSVYEDKGVTGVNVPDIDFGWKGGVISPEFRAFVESLDDALLEKCIIYDGGARRYEIPEHIKEVCEYWRDLSEAAHESLYKKFLEEKIGYSFPVGYEEWLDITHYRGLEGASELYESEKNFIAKMALRPFRESALSRLKEFKSNMQKYE